MKLSGRESKNVEDHRSIVYKPETVEELIEHLKGQEAKRRNLPNTTKKTSRLKANRGKSNR